MPHPVIAVYPGTFDPITLGHQDLIRRAAGLFGRVIVAVAAAHHKKTMFSLDERLETVREVVGDYGNVQVESFTGLVRDFAVDHGAQVMLRGVRSVTDFDFENQLAHEPLTGAHSVSENCHHDRRQEIRHQTL